MGIAKEAVDKVGTRIRMARMVAKALSITLAEGQAGGKAGLGPHLVEVKNLPRHECSRPPACPPRSEGGSRAVYE